MAILGYNTKGGSVNSGLTNGRLYTSVFTLASDQELQELHGWFSGGVGSTVRVVIYADSSGSPGARVAYTGSLSLTGSDADLSQSGFAVALPAGDYWIGFYCISGAGAGYCYCEDTGSTHKGIVSGASNPPPDPFGSVGTTGTRKHSCWAVVGAPAVVAPVADFSAAPLSGVAPLSVDFVDESTNTPTSWAWDFGDGDTDTVQDPTHEYAAAGSYDVELVATNAGGSDTETKANYVTVDLEGGGPPTSRFQVAFSADTLEPSPTWTGLDE